MKSPELKDRLEESEKLIQEMTVTWEEKLRKTEEIAQVRASCLRREEPRGSWRSAALSVFVVLFWLSVLKMVNVAPLYKIWIHDSVLYRVKL